MNEQVTKYSAVAGGGVAVGIAVGYFIAKKRLEGVYRGLADEEIASVKDQYKRREKTDEYSSPEKILKAKYGETVTELGYHSEVTDEEVAETLGSNDITDDIDGNAIVIEKTNLNIFENTEEIENVLLSDRPRTPDAPYLISADEFMQNEVEYDQISLSYFEGDKTLADEREEIIPDIEMTVGADNLLEYGRTGDADKHVVYVRNELLKTDFEIVQEEGSYSVMILGEQLLEESMSHARTRKPRNDRDD